MYESRESRDSAQMILEQPNLNLTSVPVEIMDMTNLGMVYLSGNRIQQLPEDFFQRLPKLSRLDLRGNSLSVIPTGIKNHSCLAHMFLSDNRIQLLPLELGLVPRLEVLTLEGNPLVYPERTVLERGARHICDYLKHEYEKKHGGETSDHEVNYHYLCKKCRNAIDSPPGTPEIIKCESSHHSELERKYYVPKAISARFVPDKASESIPNLIQVKKSVILQPLKTKNEFVPRILSARIIPENVGEPIPNPVHAKKSESSHQSETKKIVDFVPRVLSARVIPENVDESSYPPIEVVSSDDLLQYEPCENDSEPNLGFGSEFEIKTEFNHVKDYNVYTVELNPIGTKPSAHMIHKKGGRVNSSISWHHASSQCCIPINSKSCDLLKEVGIQMDRVQYKNQGENTELVPKPIVDFGSQAKIIDNVKNQISEVTQMDSIRVGKKKVTAATNTSCSSSDRSVIEARYAILEKPNQNLSQLPIGMLNMRDLILVNLSYNRIDHLPENFFQQLPKLRRLDLHNNKLMYIPRGIKGHTTLLYLNLANNRIGSLPVELGLVPKLEVLAIEGNPIIYPDEDVLRLGIAGICKYLKRAYRKKHGRIPLSDTDCRVVKNVSTTFTENEGASLNSQLINVIDMSKANQSSNSSLNRTTYSFQDSEDIKVEAMKFDITVQCNKSQLQFEMREINRTPSSKFDLSYDKTINSDSTTAESKSGGSASIYSGFPKKFKGSGSIISFK